MVSKVIELFKTDITALPFVERYGGLTTRVNKTVELSSGLLVKKSYPVSSSVSGQQCWENNRYLDLVPNSQFKSVIYYEQVRDTLLSEEVAGRRSKMNRFETEIRLVGWINLAQVGITETSINYKLIPTILKALYEPKDVPSGHDLENIVYKVEISNIILESKEYTRNEIFGKYNYDTSDRIFFYPFDYFSLRFKLTWHSPINCEIDLGLTAPISCIDLTSV